jgi:hypothetical protein
VTCAAKANHSWVAAGHTGQKACPLFNTSSVAENSVAENNSPLPCPGDVSCCEGCCTGAAKAEAEKQVGLNEKACPSAVIVQKEPAE